MPSGEFIFGALLTLSIAALSFYNWYLHFRINDVKDEALQTRGEALNAQTMAHAVQRQLEAHRLSAAETYALRDEVNARLDRIQSTLEAHQGRIQSALDEIRDRLPRRET